MIERYRARPQAARARNSNLVSGGQCQLFRHTILRRFSWPSLAYMYRWPKTLFIFSNPGKTYTTDGSVKHYTWAQTQQIQNRHDFRDIYARHRWLILSGCGWKLRGIDCLHEFAQ